MNSKWHLRISFTKSIIRLFGCVLSLFRKQWGILAVALAIAEVLGILEELGDER